MHHQPLHRGRLEEVGAIDSPVSSSSISRLKMEPPVPPPPPAPRGRAGSRGSGACSCTASITWRRRGGATLRRQLFDEALEGEILMGQGGQHHPHAGQQLAKEGSPPRSTRSAEQSAAPGSACCTGRAAIRTSGRDAIDRCGRSNRGGYESRSAKTGERNCFARTCTFEFPLCQ